MENTERQLIEKKIYQELIYSISELENSYKKVKDKETKSSIKKILKSLYNINHNLESISDYKIDRGTKKALHTIFSNGMSMDTLELLDKFRAPH